MGPDADRHAGHAHRHGSSRSNRTRVQRCRNSVYAGSYDIEAGRLFGSGVGGCVAPVIVHLLNYVLP
jgi:hypothetical protein